MRTDARFSVSFPLTGCVATRTVSPSGIPGAAGDLPLRVAYEGKFLGLAQNDSWNTSPQSMGN